MIEPRLIVSGVAPDKIGSHSSNDLNHGNYLYLCIPEPEVATTIPGDNAQTTQVGQTTEASVPAEITTRK